MLSFYFLKVFLCPTDIKIPLFSPVHRHLSPVEQSPMDQGWLPARAWARCFQPHWFLFGVRAFHALWAKALLSGESKSFCLRMGYFLDTRAMGFRWMLKFLGVSKLGPIAWRGSRFVYSNGWGDGSLSAMARASGLGVNSLTNYVLLWSTSIPSMAA